MSLACVLSNMIFKKNEVTVVDGDVKSKNSFKKRKHLLLDADHKLNEQKTFRKLQDVF